MFSTYKKNFFFSVLFITATALLFSCGKNTEQTTEQKNAQADTTINATAPVASTNQSELLRLIVSPQGGDFRGFKWGDPLSKIKAEEKFELFEDSTSHVGFTYETENFEAFDILYYLDTNQAMTGIRVDIYLNDANLVRNLSEQLDTYLSGKYTLEKKGVKSTTWQGTGGIAVVLKDVSKGKDFGLRLSMGLKGSKAMSM